MMRWIKRVMIVLIVIVVGVPVAGMFALSMRATRPADLGVLDGRLRDCPGSPNCVASRTDHADLQIDPLQYSGTPEEAMDRLRRALQNTPRMKVVTDSGEYLHVEATTLVFRFVDDLEFLLDRGSNQIHVRSSSRVGEGDMGTNRKRMEALRDAWARQSESTREP